MRAIPNIAERLGMGEKKVVFERIINVAFVRERSAHGRYYIL